MDKDGKINPPATKAIGFRDHRDGRANGSVCGKGCHLSMDGNGMTGPANFLNRQIDLLANGGESDLKSLLLK